MGETPGSVVTLLCSGMHFFQCGKADRGLCAGRYGRCGGNDIGRTGTLQLHLGSHCDPFLQKIWGLRIIVLSSWRWRGT